MPGRRKALVIGINYAGTDCELRGSVNDALRWVKVLTQHYGFDRKSLLAMIDEYPSGELVGEDDDNYSQPTKEGIMEALEWLVEDCLEGDCLVFVFCGHAAQVPDRMAPGDEALEEALCPMDWDEFEWGIIPQRLITDEMLHRYFARLPGGVLLTLVLDASFAGAPLRQLPLQLGMEFPGRELDNELVTQDMYGSFRVNCNAWLHSQHVMAVPRRLPCEPERPLWARLGRLLTREEAPPLSEGLAVFCIIAARQSQSAMEAWLEGVQQGNLTYCLLQALELRQYKDCSYLDWLEAAHEVAEVLRAQIMPYMDQYFQIAYGKNAGPDECRVFDAKSTFVAQDRAKRRRGQKHRPV